MKKWLRRIGIGLGGLIGLLVLAAIIIPLVVDVDKYRPQILEQVNQQINGKAELGKLSLSLWGQIRVQADGLSLTDSEGRKVVAVKDVYFHLPFSSILAGAPAMRLKMQKPELFVVKDKKGNLNVLTLMKPAAKQTPAPVASEGSGTTSLPGIAQRAKLGLEMRDALLSYRDDVTALTADVKDLNVLIKDLSMSRPTEIEVWANLDTKMGKSLTVRGPARMHARLAPQFAEGALQSAQVDLGANLDGLIIDMPTLFHKGADIAANAEGRGKLVGSKFTLESFAVRFHNVDAGMSGTVDLAEPETNKALSMDLKIQAKPIELKPWNKLVPMLKAYELGGTAGFNAELTGTSTAPQYRANVSVQKMTAKAPMLKAQPVIDADLRVVTDRIDDLRVRMKAPGNELAITGRVIGFMTPKVDISVVSPGMDLDQLVDFPPPAKKTAASSGTPAKKSGVKEADYDAMLAPLRENEIAAKTDMTITAKLASFKAYGVKMREMDGKATFKNLVAKIDSFRMGVFSGTIASHANVNLAPRTPTYGMSVNVAGLNLKEAVASQMELFKNTLVGTLAFKMDATGSSLNPDPAKKNLRAKGNFSVADASFATIDIAKVAAEAISKSLGSIAAKVPQLKNTKLNPPANYESRYAKVSSDFTIDRGVFLAPNFVAVSLPGKGLDLKGSTRLGLLDYALRAEWLVIDTHNLTTARNLSVEQNGIKVDHILAEGKEPVKFPILVEGTAFEPKPSYTAVPEALGKVVLANVSKALQGKAKAELQKQAEQQIKKIQAPKQVQDALQGFGKKLFGN